MFNMIFENKDGKQLHFGAGSPYTITEFDGLNPPKATINTNTTATLDGGMFNSSKLEMRSINVAFAIEEDAEANRLAIYKVIQTKMPLRIYYQSDLLDIFIDGYVDECEISYFAQKNIVTVSVLCPFPYFKGAQEIINDLSAVIAKFHFPFFSAQSKNLIPYPYDFNSGTVNRGITFTYDSEGVITANGRGTETSLEPVIVLESRAFFLSANTHYILSCETSSEYCLGLNIWFYESPTDSNTTNKHFYFKPAGSENYTQRNNYRLYQTSNGYSNNGVVVSYVEFYLTEDSYASLQIRYKSGTDVVVDNDTLRPMLRAANIESDVWQSPTYKEQFIMGEVDTLTSAAVENDGAVETGLTFELYAKAPLSDPKIIDYYTSEFLELDIDMLTGDLITITTGQGNKTVTLLRDGVRTNIFNLLSKNSTWLQLPIGGGVYVYEVGTGTVTNLDVTIKHFDLYEGV